jgi:hypothetical protein
MLLLDLRASSGSSHRRDLDLGRNDTCPPGIVWRVMRLGDYDPSTLGEIAAVDVVSIDLAGYYEIVPRGNVNPFVITAPVNEIIRSPSQNTVRLTDGDAQRIAELWRRLPPTEPARCHTPRYGLRFWLAGQKVIEASLCWECSNAYGYAGETRISFTFDPRSQVAVSLLMQLRQVLPDQPT